LRCALAALDATRDEETMLTWFSDGRRLLAAAIIFAAVVGAWMFRYDRMERSFKHQNRFTGTVCNFTRYDS
jgi:hypothetical protein